MKKHKKIGVVIALLIVVALGVTGVFWYKNNVFIGVKDVEAKLNEPFTCDNGDVVNLKAKDDGSNVWTVTGPKSPYEVNIYVGTQSVASAIQEEAQNAKNNKNAQVKTMGQWASDRPGDFINNGAPVDTLSFSGGTHSFETTKYLNMGQPGYTVIISLWVEGEQEAHDENGAVVLDKDKQVVMSKYYCGYRGFEDVGGPIGNEPNPYKYVCEEWANSDAQKSYPEAPDITINKNVEDYRARGFYEDFVALKREKVSEICSDGSPDPNIKNILESIQSTEKLFDNEIAVREKTNTGTNDQIGNPEDYEERREKGTKINDLYCKVNSVYLADVDGGDKLETADANHLALNLKGDPSADAATKENALDGSGEAKPNLYLFKYTADPVTKEYSLVTSDGQGGFKETNETKEACKVNCTEYVKVNFDPPQEVTAGTCFSYAVQVIAYTECEALPSENGRPVKPQPSSVRPRCHDGESIGAGPEEEFDSCVKSCDGGKYTDSCSVKCLNEVYGAGTSDVVIVDGDSKVRKTANTTLSSSSAVMPKFMANDDIGPDADKCPAVTTPRSEMNKVREFFQTHTSGYFFIDKNNNRITFKSYYPGCYWAQYAPYYYLNDWGWQTMSDHDMHWNVGVCHDTSKCEIQAPSCTTENACSIGVGGQNGGGGFLVDVGVGKKTGQSCDLNSETPYCDNLCDTTCWYDSTSGAGNFMSDADANAVYQENVNRYTQKLAECTAAAACKSTSETKSTFYIGVNEDTDKWSATNDTGTTKEPEHSGKGCIGTAGDLIIQGRDSTKNTITDGTGGLCYCGNEDYNEWQHYTRWTFPGRWVDKKSNKVTDQPPKEGAEGFYDGGYNKYCIDKNEKKDVNVNWLEQLINNKNKYETEKDARLHMTENDIEKWNISARTEHFGNYDWTISTKCFYSLTTKTVKIDPPEDPSDPDNPSTPDNSNDTSDDNEVASISSVNTRIKAADPENPIPAKGGDGKAESFNWSESATKLDVVSDDGFVYEITPGAYRKYVEDIGDDVFTSDYLDYEFEFTGSDLRNIAREGETFGDYSSGDAVAIVGTKENKANSLYAYKSNFIRTLNYTKMPSDKAIRCNNLDSKGTNKGATRCADTSNGVIPSTDALQKFKDKMNKN